MTWDISGHRFFGLEQNFQMHFYGCIKHRHSQLFKNYDSIRDIAIRAQDGVPITLAETDCLGLKYSDTMLLGIGFYLISFLLSMLIPIIIKVGIHSVKLFILMVNTMFAFGVATELQTVAGLDD